MQDDLKVLMEWKIGYTEPNYSMHVKTQCEIENELLRHGTSRTEESCEFHHQVVHKSQQLDHEAEVSKTSLLQGGMTSHKCH